jgi:hypothetical protein
MEVQPRSPQAYTWVEGPVHHYHVVFWRQPYVPPEQLRDEGTTQERIVWAAQENDLLGAEDVLEALRWADEEARNRNAIFTLYAVSNRHDREGLIWLAGWDPTRSGPRNFTHRRPSDVNPVSGAPAEVYRRRDES